MDDNRLNAIKQRILGKKQAHNESGRENTVETDGEVGTNDVIMFMLIGLFGICSIYAIVDTIIKLVR